MADFMTVSERSALMRAVKSNRTKPERMLGTALRARKLRPEGNSRDLPGKPDVVFRHRRLACFVDGEFWHGGQWRRRNLSFLEEQFTGTTEHEYWTRKVHANIERDIRATGELLALGWSVARFWAGEIEADVDAVADRVMRMHAGRERPSPFSFAATATAADFFAGIGLMRMGLKSAGWRTVWANDCSSMKLSLYEHNLGDESVILDPRRIEQVGVRRIPRVGLIAACFPCTDLSLAGACQGLEKGAQSSAYLRFADLLSQMGRRRPPFVILENVVGLIHSDGGRDFRTCLQRLADCGFQLDAVMVDAARFVPQSRARLFVIGVRNDVQLQPFSSASELMVADDLRPSKLIEFMRANHDLPWAIRSLPPLPTCTRVLFDVCDRFDPSDAAWWPAARIRRLQEQVSPRHRSMLESRIQRHGTVLATAFRRMRNGRSMAELRFDGIAGCLRTPKGGSAKQILIRADQKGWMVRHLNARECSRLMGAEGFKLDVEGISENDALFGFGDAVCVPAVEWLVRNYVNPIMAELLRGKLFALS